MTIRSGATSSAPARQDGRYSRVRNSPDESANSLPTFAMIQSSSVHSSGLLPSPIFMTAEVNEASAANNVDKYFSYCADDLVAIFYNEHWTPARYREDWPKYVKAGNVAVSAKLSDMIVRLAATGDVAVVRPALAERESDRVRI